MLSIGGMDEKSQIQALECTQPVRRVWLDRPEAISRFCQSWNEHCRPFSWTKPADEILAKLNRKDASATEH